MLPDMLLPAQKGDVQELNEISNFVGRKREASLATVVDGLVPAHPLRGLPSTLGVK